MARPASQTWGITGERNDTWNRVSARDYPRLGFEIKISYALEPISSVESFDGTKNHSIGFPWENIIARKKRKLSLSLSPIYDAKNEGEERSSSRSSLAMSFTIDRREIRE